MRLLSLSIALALSSVLFIAPQAAQATMYAPGATLDPACAPTDSNCGVQSNTAVGTLGQVPYYAAAGNVLAATSTFQILANGTASTTSLVVSNSFTLANLSGFLKATAGAIATSLINLASDVTGILPVANGGTGVAAIQSGFIPFGNGTGAVATSSAFFFDSVNGRLGIGTTSPFAKFSLAGSAGGTTNLFAISTSTSGFATSTALIIDQNGNIGIGMTNPRVALDVNGTVYAKGPAADVRAFGAKGDGVTDDTAAVQATLNASLNVYFPSGTYIVSNLTTQNNQRLFGDGSSSIIKYKVGSTGYLIEGGSNALRFQNLDIDGGNTSSYSGTVSPGTQSGIHIDVTQNKSLIDGVSIHGFNNVAIGFNGDTTPTHESVVISNSFISNNYIAIDTGPGGASHDTGLGGVNGGEYSKIIGNTINSNRYGIIVDSGNTNITGNNISSNGYCLYINGAVSNGSHGTFSSNLCNHSTVYAAYITNAVYGFTILGNQFFYGDWYMAGSDGITVTNNTIAATNMTLSGTGWISFKNNWFYSDTVFTNTATNVQWDSNYNSVTKKSIYTTALLMDTNIFTTYSQWITNGTFASDTIWTKGTGWTISTGAAHATNATGNLSQTMTAGTSNKTFVITYTASNFVSGSMSISVGGQSVSSISVTNGTHVYLFTAPSNSDGNLYFAPTSYTGDISNVSVYPQSESGELPTLNVPYMSIGTTTPAYQTSAAQLSINSATIADGRPALLIASSTSTRFVVTNGGFVGIGTTSPFALLSVSNSVTTPANTTLFAIASTTNGTATTTVFSIASTGNVTINGSSGSTCTIGGGSGATMCSSDERLKTNITVIPNALHDIEQLKGVTFNWADTTKNQNQFIGVIAQDVQKVFPQAVATLPNGYLGVDYAALVAPLIEAVKELAGKVSGFAQSFTSRDITAKHQLCIGTTCVTESQLKTLLQNNGQQSNFSQIIITDVPPTPNATTTDSASSSQADSNASSGTATSTISTVTSTNSSSTDTSVSDIINTEATTTPAS